MVSDFIHNVRQLIRNGFPKGLPVNELELKYAKYFPGTPIPDPHSIAPGCRDWTDVFRNSSKFKKWFRINGKRIIYVLRKPEPGLSVYLEHNNYLNCALVRQGLKFDPEFAGSISASESDGGVSDELVKRIKQELLAPHVPLVPEDCCAGEDHHSDFETEDFEINPSIDSIEERNQKLQVAVQNAAEGRTREKFTNTKRVQVQNQSTSPDLNVAKYCRKRWRRVKPISTSDSDSGQEKPNTLKRKRVRKGVRDKNACEGVGQREFKRPLASAAIPCPPRASSFNVAAKHETTGTGLETIPLDKSMCIPGACEITDKSVSAGPSTFVKKEIACPATAKDLAERNVPGANVSSINSGYVRPKGPPKFKIPKKTANQIQNVTLAKSTSEEGNNNTVPKQVGINPNRSKADLSEAAAVKNMRRNSHELSRQNLPLPKPNVGPRPRPEIPAKWPMAKVKPQKRDLKEPPPTQTATPAAHHTQQLPDSQIDRPRPSESLVLPINQQQDVRQPEEPVKHLADVHHPTLHQNTTNSGNVSDEGLKSNPSLTAEDEHNDKVLEPMPDPPVKSMQKRCDELCSHAIDLVNSANLAWCRREFVNYPNYLTENLRAARAFTYFPLPDFVKRMTDLLAFWDKLPPIIPGTKGYDEFQEIKRLLRIELPKLIKEYEDEQDKSHVTPENVKSGQL